MSTPPTTSSSAPLTPAAASAMDALLSEYGRLGQDDDDRLLAAIMGRVRAKRQRQGLGLVAAQVAAVVLHLAAFGLALGLAWVMPDLRPAVPTAAVLLGFALFFLGPVVRRLERLGRRVPVVVARADAWAYRICGFLFVVAGNILGGLS